MGKHLYKEGKRKCYRCREIYPLTHDFFHKSKASSFGFRYSCKKCTLSGGAEGGRRSVRKKIIKERGNKCEKCGIKNDNPSFFDIDHIRPLRDSKMRKKNNNSCRLKDRSNLQVLCPNCHRLKSLKNKEYNKAGM